MSFKVMPGKADEKWLPIFNPDWLNLAAPLYLGLILAA
jgi:hypothetical protein